MLFLLTPYSRVAALIPTPSVRAARTCTTRAMGVFNWAMGVWRVSEKDRAQGANGTGSEGCHIEWYRCAGPRYSSRYNRDIVWWSMSYSPPNDTDRPLRKSMTVHSRAV